MKFADSHCHLDHERLVGDQAGVLARARAAGVVAMLNVATCEADWDTVLATAEREPDVWCSVGVHPTQITQPLNIPNLCNRALHPRVVAIGETGLDYFYARANRVRQRAEFRSHIAAARATGLPLIVHTRDAEADTAAIMTEEMEKGEYSAVIHCFSASGEFAKVALRLGFFISISGIVTFKNAQDLQETARNLPTDRLLVETDAPFLAPVPHRGRTCEPAHVADTASCLALLRKQPVEHLAASTVNSFCNLFSKVRL